MQSVFKSQSSSDHPASPQEAPWWREGVALQGGEGAAQQDGQQCSCARTQTVTSDDQLIILQTQGGTG